MPNLDHFVQHFVHSSDAPRHRTLESGKHRNIHVNGGGSLSAFALGDSDVTPAPTFYLDTDTYSQFEHASWKDYDPVLCVPPRTSFYVKPSTPYVTTAYDSTTMTSGSVSIAGFYAMTIGGGKWIISELLLANRTMVATETIALLDSDMTWFPGESTDSGYTPFSICDQGIIDGQTLPRSDVQNIARTLVSFLYLINSNAALVVPRQTPQATNRAQRRQALRRPAPEISDVHIQHALSLDQLFHDVHAGRRLGERIAGARRTELRHSSFPMTYVRSSERYGQLERILRQGETPPLG